MNIWGVECVNNCTNLIQGSDFKKYKTLIKHNYDTHKGINIRLWGFLFYEDNY